MNSADLADYFEEFLSVESVGKYKPDPQTYRWAAQTLGVPLGETRLIAAHDWDIAGALQAGCRAAYLARPGRSYNPYYPTPDIMASDMPELAEKIVAAEQEVFAGAIKERP